MLSRIRRSRTVDKGYAPIVEEKNFEALKILLAFNYLKIYLVFITLFFWISIFF